jgi:hypothetical protein
MLIALVTVANIFSLVLVINALIGNSDVSGKNLIFAAIAIFITNIIIFAIWYWEIDQPGFTGIDLTVSKRHFLFPQYNLEAEEYKKWVPSFFDYLYLSMTNATAFSPTDTMPLTHLVKGLMGTQSAVSLLTLVLVAARAINILP